MNKQKLDVLAIGKWIATSIVVIGAALTSVNIYPLGTIVMNFGAVAWLIVALAWREWSLVVINGSLLLIYSAGLIYNYLK